MPHKEQPMEPTIVGTATPEALEHARAILREYYTAEDRLDRADVTTDENGAPILVVAVNRGHVGEGTVTDVYGL
jgi:hypothetical protein